MLSFEERVTGVAEETGGVAVLVLFGSRASGTARADSDLDVAVLPVSRDSGDRRRLVARLAAGLADLAPGGRVDIVLLDEAPELLRQRIMESGRLLLCREPDRWRDLRVATMREHGDREPFRRLMREAQRSRLMGGSNGRSGRALGSLERVGRLPR